MCPREGEDPTNLAWPAPVPDERRCRCCFLPLPCLARLLDKLFALGPLAALEDVPSNEERLDLRTDTSSLVKLLTSSRGADRSNDLQDFLAF